MLEKQFLNDMQFLNVIKTYSIIHLRLHFLQATVKLAKKTSIKCINYIKMALTAANRQTSFFIA